MRVLETVRPWHKPVGSLYSLLRVLEKSEWCKYTVFFWLACFLSSIFRVLYLHFRIHFSGVFLENMVALMKNVTNRYGPTWYVHASSGFIMYLVAVNVTSAVSKPFQWDWPDQYIHFEQLMLEDLCRRVCDLVWLEVLNCLSFTGNCAKFLKCCDSCLELLLGFLIPPHMRWKRKVAVLERLTAILVVAKTLVWFHANLHCRVAKSMWPLLTVNVQMALIGNTVTLIMLRSWLHGTGGFFLHTWIVAFACIFGLQGVFNTLG